MVTEEPTGTAPVSDEAIALVRTWLAAEPGTARADAGTPLEAILREDGGLAFAVELADGVARPRDPLVAGYNLNRVAARTPDSLPWRLRAAARVGGALGPVVPWIVVPVARRALRRLVERLTVPTTPDGLSEAIADATAHGARGLSLTLPGGRALGEREAVRRFEAIRALLARDDVDHVSVAVFSVISHTSPWAFDDAVARAVDRLTPLFEIAAARAADARASEPAAAAAPPAERPARESVASGRASEVPARPPDGGESFTQIIKGPAAVPAVDPQDLHGLAADPEHLPHLEDAPVAAWPRAEDPRPAPRPAVITLDVPEYGDLDLTIAVFRRLLDKPEFRGVEAGIVLQAYLPDALDALQGLTEWAIARRAAGGAPIRVRIVKGANLAMERVDALLHGWPQAPYDTRVATDANYLRLLDWALTPPHTHAVRVGVSGSNLFDLAFAWVLAERRGVTDRVEMEMPLGMDERRVDAVAGTVGGVRLDATAVDPAEFDTAIPYLVRRLEQNPGTESLLAAASALADDAEQFEREKRRFLEAVDRLAAESTQQGAPLPNRRQDRANEWQDADSSAFFHPAVARPSPNDTDPGLTSAVLGLQRGSGEASPARGPAPVDILGPFRNEEDTDPALAANRSWARRILRRVPDSQAGAETVRDYAIADSDALDRLLDTVRHAGGDWGVQVGFDRAAVLDRAALALSANRDRLIEVMASETGKILAEADPEVSEAVDLAHYYAARARELDRVQGAVFVPGRLTVVTPEWSFPVSGPANGILAALAAGSGVVVRPAAEARRCAAVVAEALWEAGVPRDLVALADPQDADGELARRLVTDDRVDRVILAGAFETARRFRSWRPGLDLFAETSGKNAVIVTPSADDDDAVRSIVADAFGHAGQKRSAASLVILVGSAAHSERFHRRLADATMSLRVGYPHDPASEVGPLIRPAEGKLLHALTTLGGGEEWLVKPRKLDESGRLWSPGIRTGVAPGSYVHLTEFFGPVLGIMHARTLEEAVRFQNAIEFGMTAGLHSLDPSELAYWLDHVEAGSLFVNRPITGAVVGRQPVGGWKRSAVGPGAKTGGPNYLIGLGSWLPDDSKPGRSLHLRGLDPRVSELIESGQQAMDYPAFDLVRRSALSDAIAWANEYGQVRELAGLGVERNLFRYRPVPVAIRMAETGDLPHLLRVMAAATLARSPFTVSCPEPLPAGIGSVLEGRDVPVTVQSDLDWVRLSVERGVGANRVRLVGGDPGELLAALGGDPDVTVFAGEVTPSGRVELLPFLREQSLSITAHRFGAPDPWSEGVV